MCVSLCDCVARKCFVLSEVSAEENVWEAKKQGSRINLLQFLDPDISAAFVLISEATGLPAESISAGRHMRQ